MKIRAMQLKDMEEVVGMMRVFYDSPAVIHAAPDEILRQDVKDCVGDCPYIEGYIFEENDRILGYSMVAKSYSTEYGGICVWVEDLYMKEEARGLGIGTAFFRFLDENYVRPLVNIYYSLGRLHLPASWGNAGKGGITIHAQAKGATRLLSIRKQDIIRCRICR